ncbi:MAG: class I SAM-dependent methyltransferase [Chloroflexaceae bacterium]
MSRVAAFYDAYGEREWTRLERHRTEFAVTLRALAEVLPPAPARVLDLGGGPGRYSVALALQGYAVTLVDVSAVQLARARAHAERSGVRLEAIVQANVLSLPETIGDSFDAVLLFGPLYHLPDASEREQAVTAAYCRLRPGGLLAAAFVSRFAPFRDSACKDPLWILQDPAYTEQVLQTGIHVRGEDFVQVYFAHPTEVVPFMEAAGLTTQALIGVEGIVAGHEEQVNALSGEAWEAWVTLNERLGRDPALIGAADHLLYLGHKPIA